MNTKTFPLYRNDGNLKIRLSNFQKKRLEELKAMIASGELVLQQNKCLCGNENEEQDIVVSEKDRYALPIAQVLCSKCGIIRSKQVFDDASNMKFYEHFYRNIYVGNINAKMKSFFCGQIACGKKFLEQLKNCIDLSKLENIVEIGCGAGGILVPFKEIGKTVSGCDFDKDYLEYGKQKGLNLIYGSSDQIQNNSADLVILSHVMEHLLHPIDEMKAIIGKIKPEKYILVEVPGIFRIANAYFNPILYFLNAHYYYYYYYYLRVFFTQLGLKVLYGDEQCTVICQKPKDWNSEKTPSIIYDDSLQAYPQKVANYLIRCKRIDRILFNASKLHLHEIACKFGWKKIRPYFLKKYRYEK